MGIYNDDPYVVGFAGSTVYDNDASANKVSFYGWRIRCPKLESTAGAMNLLATSMITAVTSLYLAWTNKLI